MHRTTSALVLAGAMLAVTSPANAAGPLCGIPTPLCERAETQAQDVIEAGCLGAGQPPSDEVWQTFQFMSPWSVVLDGSGKLRIRYWFKGNSARQLGDAPADRDWTEHDYTVTSCEGSVSEGTVKLHVGGAPDIVLTFVEGKLRRIFDPSSTHPSPRGSGAAPFVFATVSQRHAIHCGGDDWLDVRNHETTCPTGTGSAASPSTGSNATGTPPSPATSPNPSPPGITFERAPSSVSPQDRQTSTGVQGGSDGAKEVFFNSLEQQKMDCSKGIAEACRAASVMLRHAGDKAEAARYQQEACAKGSKVPPCP